MKRNLIILFIYLCLTIAGIPWYWPEDSTMMIAGIPAWVMVSILVSILVSIFTAYLLLTHAWSTDDPFDG